MSDVTIPVTVALVGRDDTIELDHNPEYLRMFGWKGFGKAPVANYKLSTIGDGFIYRGSRVTERKLTIPIAAFGDDPLVVGERLRRLVRLVSGLITLRATYPNGDSYTIPILYNSGLDGAAYGQRFVKFDGVVFECPDPYWSGSSTRNIVWSNDTQYDFLATLTLSGSSLTGIRNINNEGDVPSRPTWVFTGALTKIDVQLGDGGFVWDGTLADGEQLRIQYIHEAGQRGWLVTDDTGANRYAEFEGTPRFPTVPVGLSTANLVIEGASPTTQVTMAFPERREVVF